MLLIIWEISMSDLIKKASGKVANRIRELEQIKTDKESGKTFYIPFENYPKLS